MIGDRLLKTRPLEASPMIFAHSALPAYYSSFFFFHVQSTLTVFSYNIETFYPDRCNLGKTLGVILAPYAVGTTCNVASGNGGSCTFMLVFGAICWISRRVLYRSIVSCYGTHTLKTSFMICPLWWVKPILYIVQHHGQIRQGYPVTLTVTV